jgi:hypothetical protein
MTIVYLGFYLRLSMVVRRAELNEVRRDSFNGPDQRSKTSARRDRFSRLQAVCVLVQ